MKTVKEWFETLPEPYRTQAINNTRKEFINSKDKSLKEALSRSFVWFKSPEGQNYWEKLYDTL